MRAFSAPDSFSAPAALTAQLKHRMRRSISYIPVVPRLPSLAQPWHPLSPQAATLTSGSAPPRSVGAGFQSESAEEEFVVDVCQPHSRMFFVMRANLGALA